MNDHRAAAFRAQEGVAASVAEPSDVDFRRASTAPAARRN